METCDGSNNNSILTMIPLKYRRKVHRYRPIFVLLAIAALWLVVLEPCLIGIMEFCHNDKVYDGGKKSNVKAAFRIIQKKPVKACSIFSLEYGSNLFYHIQDDDVLCKPATPLRESCNIANQLFFSEPPASCSHQTHHEFCRLESSPSQPWFISCDETKTKICASQLSLGLPSPETGNLDWITFNNTQKLAMKLTSLLRQPDSHSRHYGFAFIKCTSNEIGQVSDNQSDYTSFNDYYQYQYYSRYRLPGEQEQLLILPPYSKLKKTFQSQDNSGFDVNVNIILIDSVSRQHFFRSLKKSVAVLESFASNNNSSAYVFDFSMLQSVKSRTFETLQALFSGYVNITETPFPVHGMSSKPLNLAPIFQNFRNRFYRTLWLEDLCYLWEWGISKDLHFLNLNQPSSDTWKNMWKKLEENGVDDVDLTISMCRILDANNMKDPFRDTNTVCFNGKHQHEYILEYLKLYQSEMKAMGQSFLTVSSTNVGHEETGRRIQTLDSALAQYITFLPTLDNTLSIIFSDHGNAYGQFFQHSNEAQAELFHPFMFFILPKNAASKFSQEMLSALRINTKRLISVLDVHHTLLFLANSHTEISNGKSAFLVSRRGLFEAVDVSRNCESVPRIPPNQCICSNQEKAVKSSSFQGLFGYHAVGAINSEIQKQFVLGVQDKALIHKAYGRCQPLILHDVSNIRENPDSSEGWKISMNIHVQDSQVFFVSVIIQTHSTGQKIVMLETISRITKYAPYEKCVDPGVELSMCICNISAPSYNTQPISETAVPDYAIVLQPIPHFEHTLQRLSGHGCICIFSVTHNHGMAVFVTSSCEKSFLFHLDVLIDKKHIYSAPPPKVLLLPGSFVYLALVINESEGYLDCPLQSHTQEVKDVNHYLSLLLR